jgi:di/tricarboxylate transporter
MIKKKKKKNKMIKKKKKNKKMIKKKKKKKFKLKIHFKLLMKIFSLVMDLN